MLGRTFAGRYRILDVLSEGGMGTVYLAEHLRIGRHVALKRLHPELANNARAVVRFQREARAAASTLHDNIIDVFDLGYDEDGAPFLVMEYLRGESLAETILRQGRLEPERVCRIAAQVLDALSTVHRRQIVHRDLKPDNIFLTQRGNQTDFVKLLDFGVSKMLSREDDSATELTRSGVMLGTPYYMSPEQARGTANVDHRVDIYAVGVILYETLSGRMPFDGPNYHALLQAIVRSQPLPLQQLQADVPTQLADVAHRAMALSPGDRYPSAEAMLAEIHACQQRLAEMQASSPAPRSGAEEPAASHVSTLPVAAAASLLPMRPKTPIPTLRAMPYGQAAQARQAPVLAVQESVAAYTSLAHAPSSAPTSTPVLLDAARDSDTSARVKHAVNASAEVRGLLLSRTLSAIETRFGKNSRSHVLQSLASDVQPGVEGIILPIAWFPVAVLEQVIHAAGTLFGGDANSAATWLGQSLALEDLPSLKDAVIACHTHQAAVELVGRLAASLYQPGKPYLRLVSEGDWELQLHHIGTTSSAHARLIQAMLAEIIRRSSVPAMETELLSPAGRQRGLVSLRLRTAGLEL